VSPRDHKSEAFAKLHQPGQPLVVFNVWDAGSAQAVVRAGAKALATGSYSVAGANGYGDGEKVPLDIVIANARRIAQSTELPVSLDFETGYHDSPSGLKSTFSDLVDTGIVGINIEDQVLGEPGLRAISEQCDRISAGVEAGLFVNARTDLFIKAPVDTHDDALVDLALERARAFASAGAGCFFVPMRVNPILLEKICLRCPLPVNVMMKADAPSHDVLAKLGVARISYGPGPWRDAMSWIEDRARLALFHPEN
jgi:2-methylisocitrate lyase-like PEP mutase family enzyme